MAEHLTVPTLPALADEAQRGRDEYARFLKPRVHERLAVVGLDVAYERAEGDYLFYRDAGGAEVRVLDMLGGFGASLFGHNHPALVARARAVLDEQRPFNAQASVRALSGRLAARLSEVVGRATKREYVVTLASTGAEAVEAAIKHAELDLIQRIEGVLGGISRKRHELYARLRAQSASVPARTFETASLLLGGAAVTRVEDLLSRVEEHTRIALHAEPIFLALERAFHGKSTGALSLTANPEYRTAWRRIGLRTVFLAAGDEAALARAVESARVHYLDFRFADDGAFEIEQRSVINVAACFLEPIQGEGGVRPLPPAFVRAVRAEADRAGFAIVMDEIQSGVGRTGTFLASESYGVRAEYYLLSKSLGGGLAKVSALLVERERYVPRFGLLHTSTFAEDDPSSAVALGVLDLLEADGGALLRDARTKGDCLRARLDDLRKRYPSQITDVRGAGLMIGLELGEMDRSPSTFLRVASEQGLLAYVVAGYLLHEERVRVMPTLSSPFTIRLQPSVYVTDDAIDHLIGALERCVRALRDLDVDVLVRHLVGRARVPTRGPRGAHDAAPPTLEVRSVGARARVAFLGHFLDANDVRDWDPGLAALTNDECGRFVARTRSTIEPMVLLAATVRSRKGDAVDLTVIGVPFLSEQVMASFRAGDVRWARAMIEAGIAIAKERGARVIGFGGYTSIVTDNCRDVADGDTLVTSGNSLTAAATVEAVLRAKERFGPRPLRLGVVGALGNIGAVLAELLSNEVDSIVLVGRPGAERRLGEREDALYAAVLRRFATDRDDRGIARALLASPLGRAWTDAPLPMADHDGDWVGAIARAAMHDTVTRAMNGGAGLGAMARAGLGSAAPISIATDMRALRSCNVIVAATNAPRPVITSDHLGEGPIVVCDVAAPGDVDPEVGRVRRDVTVLEGGMVRLPLGQSLRIRGMSAHAGSTYGCLGETILSGLAGLGESLSLGALTVRGVRLARELALDHGYGFEDKPRDRTRDAR